MTILAVRVSAYATMNAAIDELQPRVLEEAQVEVSHEIIGSDTYLIEDLPSVEGPS